jgi:hypothetical protein
MQSNWLGVGLAAALALAAQGAVAQLVSGCPAGQAMQSIDRSGQNVTCVPVSDSSGLQAQITAETAARTAADAQLHGAIGNERNQREVMDSTLQSAIDQVRADAIEASIVGTYTFSGTQTCFTSSFGFNDDLTPRAAPAGSPSAAVVSHFTVNTSGTRTFNADGTGSAHFLSQSISVPGAFYTNPLPPGTSFSGLTNGGPNGRPGGSGNAAEQTSAFTWQVLAGKLIIDDGDAVGTFMRGPSTGCTVTNSNSPRTVGVLGKDLRIITIMHEDMQVEFSNTTCPNGNVFSSQRICNRERTLRKM